MARFTATWVFLVLALASTGCMIIDDGEVGVVKRFGSIADEPLNEGPTMVIPVIRQVEVWDVKLQEMKQVAELPSSEGLIVHLEASLLYEVTPSLAPQIRKTIGRDYREKLVTPYFRSQLRDVVSGYPVRSIYSEEGRALIATQVLGHMRDKLGERGITVADILLREVQLPQRFKESIEAKLTAQQRVQQKEFELAQAVKDAEIEIARARGAAQAQEIVRSTLSSSYLHYLWIKTLNENPNVIYVATEANMPIFKNVK